MGRAGVGKPVQDNGAAYGPAARPGHTESHTPDTPPRSLAKLCLKARPTPVQLADRLRPVDGLFPDGLELYLDAADIADQAAMDAAVGAVEAHQLPRDFALLVEGPVGSLDGQFFDVTRDSDADHAVLERLAGMARRLGAVAVNVHVIAPSDDLSRLTLACRDELLRRAVPFLRRFVDLTRAAGAVPTIENMPPVLRMRRGGYYFTPIGMASEDLRWLVEQIPGLGVLPDTSHTGLYLNARRAAAVPAGMPAPSQPGSPPSPREHEGAHTWLDPLLAFARQLPQEPPDLLGYFRSLAPHVANAQVSNAAGITGEGLEYRDGDYDLDPVVRWLGTEARHIVTETLEPNPDEARTMRDALRCMRMALA